MTTKNPKTPALEFRTMHQYDAYYFPKTLGETEKKKMKNLPPGEYGAHLARQSLVYIGNALRNNW